jgi:hypothetical protein
MVRFVKQGDTSPSCGLVQKDRVYIELVAPEPGTSWPACASPIRLAARIKLKESYLVYEYKVEDSKASVSSQMQILRLNGVNLKVCMNDDQLTNKASQNMNFKGIEAAFRHTLVRLGCER